MQQPGGGVEALFQGAAKGVMERGERLGINQAVRDAIGEIRRNVQSLQDARTRSSMDQDRANFADETGSRAIAAMESRNRHLAALLDESIADLKAMAASRLHGEKEALSDALELAAAKIQLVKVYLEDNTLALPGQELPAINTLKLSSPRKPGPSPTVALDTTPVIMSSTAIEAARASPSPSQQGKSTAMPRDAAEAVDRMDTDDDAAVGPDSPEHARVASGALSPARSPAPSAAPDELPAAPGALRESRPHGPIPTRSTLAQSSFSWMLEPDASPSSSSPLSSGGPPSTTGRPHGGHRKPARGARRSASRERNAFLFGEVGGEGAAERRPSAEEGFGLQPIRKSVASGSGSRGGLAR
ncbi:hypothetical protein P8C59_004699 [Phyllachora maydis]|uniref:Uncharacterized protein n=3 Tax=Phyllachora maydis TaxID=1825666 RepID=A0AAD9I456_9PEZI|nr:hypothetical protein P8C59_004699 [Phyllachora maydis]